MLKTKRRPRLRLALIALVLALTLFFTGRKINEYAADPLGEKDCPPLLPGPTDDTAQAKIIDLPGQNLPWKQKGGTINDASCLNRTPVFGIVQVKTVADIENALLFAKENNLKIAPAGVRHSMGGQAFFRNALVLDMTQFNRISLNEAGKTVTVQSGATWHDIQNLLHPTYAVKAMQSTDIFTVGGSISVNAHGMDHQVGAIGKTIRSMQLMLPDGSIQTLSPTENRELFDLVIGGYGLFGIILEVELEIVDNVIYEPGRQLLDYHDFPELYAQQLTPDQNLGLMYGHLSTAPQSFLQEMILYTYERVAADNPEIEPLGEVSNTKLRRFVLNFSKQGAWPMRLKWFAEKYVEPHLESCSVSRNQAMKEGEACLVSRNQPMHDSVNYLKNNLQSETDILQEYYIPQAQFVPFVDGLREIMLTNEANLLNASVRVVHQEDNFLNYAPTDMFAVVLYLNQNITAEDTERMRRVTEQVIDLAISLDGTFFLPYQLSYSPAQLQQAYPEIEAFFAAKKQYDPDLVLTNTFYETFAPHFAADQ
jgi:FAD/FMN-containing dehydrogenase